MAYEFDQEDDKKFNKKKIDILYLLNNKDRKGKPKKIKRYNIKYDEKQTKLLGHFKIIKTNFNSSMSSWPLIILI